MAAASSAGPGVGGRFTGTVCASMLSLGASGAASVGGAVRTGEAACATSNGFTSLVAGAGGGRGVSLRGTTTAGSGAGAAVATRVSRDVGTTGAVAAGCGVSVGFVGTIGGGRPSEL